jgi:hypothetical protein
VQIIWFVHFFCLYLSINLKREKMKIEILDGWVDLDEKLCREVEGTIVINNTEYGWHLLWMAFIYR